MPTMIFYDTPIALNRDRHRNLKLDRQTSRYDFARFTNSVLLAATELPEASKDYPVVFVGKDGGDYTLAALVGLRDRENLFIEESGDWLRGRYLPAFVRRYPFVLAEGEGDTNLTVCIDESFPGLTEVNGEALFDGEGKETALLSGSVEFLRLFHAEMNRTRAFATRLAALGLLQPKTIRVQRDRKQEVLDGFFVIDEQKLRALADSDVLDLHRSGFLAWAYAHLHSLGNVERLALMQTHTVDAVS
jgi:hypothetical protein